MDASSIPELTVLGLKLEGRMRSLTVCHGQQGRSMRAATDVSLRLSAPNAFGQRHAKPSPVLGCSSRGKQFPRSTQQGHTSRGQDRSSLASPSPAASINVWLAVIKVSATSNEQPLVHGFHHSQRTAARRYPGSRGPTQRIAARRDHHSQGGPGRARAELGRLLERLVDLAAGCTRDREFLVRRAIRR